MRIGYLVQQELKLRTPPFDGPANHVRHVMAALSDLGHTVRLLANESGRLWCSDDLQEFRPVGVPRMEKGPGRWVESGVRRAQYELNAPYAAFFESLRFALACRQAFPGFDLLYERMSWVSYGGALASRWMGIPLVLENNGDLLADLEAKGIAPRGSQRRLSVGLMQRAVNQAAHVVTSGEGWRDQVLTQWKIDPERVTTVENGTDLVRHLQRDELRSFSPVADPQAPITLAYVGGFLPWHGIDVLLQALASANAHRRKPSVVAGASEDPGPGEIRLLLVGTGDGLARARQQAAELGLNEDLRHVEDFLDPAGWSDPSSEAGSVKFAGHLSTSDFAPLLARADIGVSPYCGWNEFSGLKILDYKAAGLPTITSGLDGRPATVAHGRTGLIVPPCDPDALCAAILNLCDDAERRREMGRAARLEAETCHTWEHTARRLEEIMMNVREQCPPS